MNAIRILSVAMLTSLPALAQTTAPAPIATSAPAELSVQRDHYASEIRSLDPATAGDTSSTSLQSNIFEGLYTYQYLKRPVEVVPQLAQAMPEVSKDGLTWTIKIRKGIKYQRNICFGTEADGKTRKTREVVARDFVLAFKRVADAHVTTPLAFAFLEDRVEGLSDFRDATAGYKPHDFTRYANESISGIKALDDHTLQITLTKAYPQLLYVLAMHNYAPIPQEAVDYWLAGDHQEAPNPARGRRPSPAEINDWRAMVGTGPYVVSNYVPQSLIVLDRNPEYRDDRYPTEGAPGDKEAGLLEDAGKRVPFIDRIVMKYATQSMAAWESFVDGKVDTAGIPFDVWQDVMTAKRELKPEYARKGWKLLVYEMPAVYFIGLNMKDPLMGSSKSLRQALSLSLDRQAFIEKLRNGRALPLESILPDGFEGQKEAGASPFAKHDVKQAKKLLESAKAELVQAGELDEGADLPTLTMMYPDTSAPAKTAAELMQEQFKEVGLDVKIELMEWPTFQDRLHRGQWQMAAGSGWHADYPDSDNFLQLFYSPSIESGTNTSNYSNSDFDKLFEKMAAMAPSKERTALIAKMVRMIHEDCPVILDTAPKYYMLMQPWVKNVKPHPIGYGYMKYRRIDRSAAAATQPAAK